MLDVRRLLLLRDLGRLGTIAAVAQARAYTPSAVSQQLSVLEREAGVPLLGRSGRRVALTAAAVTLVRHAEEVLAALERADAALAAAQAGLSGTLRIGAFPSAARTLLPAALVALARDHPGLDLELTELDPVDVPDAVRDRRLDLALVHDYDVVPAEPDPALAAQPLLDETVHLAVPTDGPPDADPDPPDPVAGFREAGWIAGTPGTLCHAVTLHACRAAGYAPRIRHHADDFGTVLALVAAGQGVALVPQLAAGRPPDGVRLVPLALRRRTALTYRRGGADHPAVAAGIAAVRRSTADLGFPVLG
ncbi:LysR family transcriptional regulator [Plantactinospora siamensis]|uniref:LysR family transcriptional regulator n=1 Tax=Plantactinospora siamensis TaxID=555372 RepID=A0ABV6NT70_9ACTN